MKKFIALVVTAFVATSVAYATETTDPQMTGTAPGLTSTQQMTENTMAANDQTQMVAKKGKHHGKKHHRKHKAKS